MLVRSWLIAAVLLGAGWLPAESLAGSGTQVVLPTGRTPIRSGLQLRLDTQWVTGSGYRPIRVTVLPLGRATFPRDRRLWLEIRPGRWQPEDSQLRVRQLLEIPQGASRHDVTVLLPQDRTFNVMRVIVTEFGRTLKDLSAEDLPFAGSEQEFPEAAPTMLVLDGDLPDMEARRAAITTGVREASGPVPDLSILATVTPFYGRGGVQAAMGPRRTPKNLDSWQELSAACRSIEFLALSDAPQNWVAYSGIDLVFVDIDDLNELKSQSPDRWTALTSWLAAGGKLCVTGLGDKPTQLQQVERLLGLATVPPTDADEPAPGWQEPDPSLYGKPLHLGMETARLTVDPQAIDLAKQLQIMQLLPLPAEAPDKPFFLVRDVGFGSLVVFADSNPFPGTVDNWRWFLNAFPDDPVLWTSRHGLSLARDNSDYWRFLIPGFGLAPVNVFRLVISVFVLLIGPVNIYLLYKWRRRSLLLATVPLGAAIAILGILGYALITDGVAVRARIRGLTHIDQARDHAVTWSRQSYYAGVAPAQGLQFPDTVAAYSVDQQPPSAREPYSEPVRQLEWGSKQRLQRGFFPPRVTCQYLVVQSEPTTRGLAIAHTEGEAPSITNQLECDIEYLCVLDKDGQTYAAGELAPQDTVVLSPVPNARICDQLQLLMQRSPLALPEDFDEASLNEIMNINRRRSYYWSSYSEEMKEPTFGTSLLERRLVDLTRDGMKGLPPGSYAAIVRGCPEVAKGAQEPIETSSLYLVTGQW